MGSVIPTVNAAPSVPHHLKNDSRSGEGFRRVYGIEHLEELVPPLALVPDRAQVLVKNMIDDPQPLGEVGPSSGMPRPVLTVAHGADNLLK